MMKKEKLKTKIEVFVCNHSRDKKECCADKGAKEFTDKLKKWSKEHHKGELKIIRSGCLGQCSDGMALLCYPEKEFILKVEEDDLEKIKKGLEEALYDVKD